MDRLVVVYRASGIHEAEIVKGYLESQDIPADLDYESVGQVVGLTLDGLGEVRVVVPVDWEEAAREAILRRPGPGPPESGVALLLGPRVRRSDARSQWARVVNWKEIAPSPPEIARDGRGDLVACGLRGKNVPTMGPDSRAVRPVGVTDRFARASSRLRRSPSR